MSLARAATSRAPRFVPPASRVIWPMPFPMSAFARSRSSVPIPTISKDQTDPSWATFSSRVIRSRRSLVRSSIESVASR